MDAIESCSGQMRQGPCDYGVCVCLCVCMCVSRVRKEMRMMDVIRVLCSVSAARAL